MTICKELYKNLRNSVADNLREYFNHIPEEKLNEIDKDLRLNYFFMNCNNQYNCWEIVRAYSWFYYELGQFPGNQESTILPQGNNQKFINSKNIISAYDLYKSFRSNDACGLVSIQYLTYFKGAMKL